MLTNTQHKTRADTHKDHGLDVASDRAGIVRADDAKIFDSHKAVFVGVMQHQDALHKSRDAAKFNNSKQHKTHLQILVPVVEESDTNANLFSLDGIVRDLRSHVERPCALMLARDNPAKEDVEGGSEVRELTRGGTWVMPNPRSRLMAKALNTQGIGSSGTSTVMSSRPFGLQKKR